MNGDQPKIEIFEPFGAAYEMMKKILFQPFDFAKWLVIGFAAFLSGLWGGGYHINFPSGGDWNFPLDQSSESAGVRLAAGLGNHAHYRRRGRRADPHPGLDVDRGAGAVHFHRLRGEESRGDRCALARVSSRGKQPLPVYHRGGVPGNSGRSGAVPYWFSCRWGSLRSGRETGWA